MPLAEGAVALLLLGELWRSRAWHTHPQGAPWLAFLFCALVSLGVAQQPNLRGLVEVGQLLGLLLVGVMVFRALFVFRPTWLHGVFVLGWLSSLVLGLSQYATATDPVEICEALGYRALFGILLVALMPIVLLALARVSEGRSLGWRALSVSGAILLSGLVVVYGPAWCLLLVGVVLTCALCLQGVARWSGLVALALVVVLVLTGWTPRPNRAWLLGSVARHDEVGKVRRWVVELQAACRAVQDKPFLGHGPGQYQRVVSSGTYRAFLPDTGEDKVEPGTQCGYLTLAVEYGLLPPLLLLALLLASAWRVYPREDPDGSVGHMLAIALLLFAVGQVATPLTVQGAGVLLSALLGRACLVPLADDDQNPWHGLTSLSVQAALIALLLIAALALGWIAAEPAPPPQPEAGPEMVVVAPKPVSMLVTEAEAVSARSDLACS